MQTQEKKSNVRGVSVRQVNFGILLLSVLLYAALLALSFHAAKEYKDMKTAAVSWPWSSSAARPGIPPVSTSAGRWSARTS